MFVQFDSCFKIHEADIKSITIIGPGQIATTSRDGVVNLLDAANNGTPIVKHSWSSKCFINSSGLFQSQFLVCGGSDGSIRIFDTKQLTLKTLHVPHGDNVCAIAASNAMFISSSWDHCSIVWTEFNIKAYTLLGHSGAVWSSCFVNDQLIATASADRTIKIWQSGECLKTLSDHTDCVRKVLHWPARKSLITLGNDGAAIVYCADTFEVRSKIPNAHDSFIYSADIIDQYHFITVGEDSYFRIWVMDASFFIKCVQHIPTPQGTNWDVKICNSNIYIASSTGCLLSFTLKAERPSQETVNLYEKIFTSCAEYDIVIKDISYRSKNLFPGVKALLHGKVYVVTIEIGEYF